MVGLLIILMRPHVRAECAGKGIVCHLLQPVTQGRIPENGEHVLDGVHALHHRAKLRALRGAPARVVLVAGMHAVGQQVVAVHLLKLPRDGVTI